ncbi:MAG: Tripartite tricarboxylate transporter TctA family, partial [uncultured Nocardioidaceae bacterium]
GCARRPRGRLRHRADPAEPAVRAPRGPAGDGGRRPPGHRARDDRRAAAPGDLRAGADQRVHHVRRHLLRRHVRRVDDVDPAQHPGRVQLDHDRARGQQDGQGRPRVGRTGHRGARVLRRRHHRHAAARPAGADGGRPRHRHHGGRLLRDLRPRLRRRRHGARRLAAARAGLPGHRPLPGAGGHRRPHRAGAVHPRRPPALGRGRRRRGGGGSVRRGGVPLRRVPAPPRAGAGDGHLGGVVHPAGPEPVVEAVAARHRLRLPARCDAGGRRGDPDVPLVRDRAEAVQAPRGVRQGRHRGRRRSGGREQRGGGRGAGAAAHPRHPDVGDRGDNPGRVPGLRDPDRPHPADHGVGPGLDAHRLAAHRQLHAAGAEPAAGRGLGEAAAHPAALPVRGHPAVRLARLLRRERRPPRPGAAAGHRAARLLHAALRLAGGARGHRAHPRPDRRDQP